MSDEKGDKITEPAEEVRAIKQAEVQQPAASRPPGAAGNKLSGLMSDGGGAAVAPDPPSADPDAEALRVAERALADGEEALTEARGQLQGALGAQVVTKPLLRKRRALLLGALLSVNVLAMIVVAALPSPSAGPDSKNDKPEIKTAEIAGDVIASRMSEPWNRAMLASEQRDFASAVSILDRYLQGNSQMYAGERLSVLSAASFYAARLNDFKKSQEYAQMVQSILSSHSLANHLAGQPDAADLNDEEALRRMWGRLQQQQRQVPSWLYQNAAQAYLELGAGYRQGSDAAVEASRLQQLAEAVARLRAETLKQRTPK